LPQIDWTPEGVHLEFRHDEDRPVRLTRFVGQDADACIGDDVPLVEVLAVGLGHTLANDRLVQSSIGAALRYRSHREPAEDTLTLRLATEGITPELEVHIELRAVAGAVRAVTTVQNTGAEPVLLTSVTSWASGLGRDASTSKQLQASDWSLIEGVNDWLGEGRWSTRPLRGALLPELREELTGHTPRSAVTRTAAGTWSTGGHLPVAGLSTAGLTWLWEIEHNGPWRWEIGEHVSDCYFALSGPTDRDHQWSVSLEPGDTFTTVPATVALGRDLPTAVAAMTAARRRNRLPHAENTAPTIVFNDYMNTLDGDPTTAKLLPLIDAAAQVGVDTFCIDAGWYSDSPDWWDTVGAWEPSTTRFPNGLAEVIDAIRDAGMTPGLWLEPEVVGVGSPIAESLPPDAFLQRRGHRVEEHDRYHLDLRHPAARAHLDAVVDRLVDEFGIGYFKLDYNIDGGPGTDRDTDSVGAGLLDHNRAHLFWLEGVLARHPDLVLENCASGAMRMDAAMLAHTQLQSTSDQQDPLLYPPIAASAGLAMLPEQAANWAYPQPDLSPEENTFTLVTGLAGRFYLSGYLNKMTDDQLARVRDAVATARSLHQDIADTVPSWPLGLPGWTDRWIASARHGADRTIVSVWDREGGADGAELRFPDLAGHDLHVTTIFPHDLPDWQAEWDADTGTLSVRNTVTTPTARTFSLTSTAPSA